MDERIKLLIKALEIDAVIFALIMLIAIAAAGCSQVQMSAAYRQELVMSNVLVQSLNADCQAGDPNACKEGLNESAKVLQLLIDAVQGVDGGPVR